MNTLDSTAWFVLGVCAVGLIATILLFARGGWVARQCETFGCYQVANQVGTRPTGHPVYRCPDHDVDTEWAAVIAAVEPRDLDEALAQWTAQYGKRP